MRQYSDELKAEILAAVATGAPIKVLARQYDMPEATIRYWRDMAQAQPLLAPEKQHDVDLLYTDFVSEALVALRTAARVGQDEVWIRSLGRDAYLWVGTLADKVLAALAAYESAAERHPDSTTLDVYRPPEPG